MVPVSYTVLKENPYQLAEDIQGIGFRIADEIAGRIGIHTDSDYRIRSGLFLYADAGSSGRTCVSAGTNTSGKGFGASWSGATAYGKTYYGSCH